MASPYHAMGDDAPSGSPSRGGRGDAGDAGAHAASSTPAAAGAHSARASGHAGRAARKASMRALRVIGGEEEADDASDSDDGEAANPSLALRDDEATASYGAVDEEMGAMASNDGINGHARAGGAHGSPSHGPASLSRKQSLAAAAAGLNLRTMGDSDEPAPVRRGIDDGLTYSDDPAVAALQRLRNTKWSTVVKRIPYYVPCLTWLPKYHRGNLVGDIIAGLSVGVMVMPQGLTYAGLANLPPIYGLYTGFFPMLIYLIMGSSRHLSIGPEVTCSILLGKTISAFPSIPKGDLTDPAVAAAVEAALVDAALSLSLLVGVVALVLGLLRLGFLDAILSKPMLHGFVMAIAVTLICEQLHTLLGLNCGKECKPGTLPLDSLIYSLTHLGDITWQTLLMSICCTSFMFSFKWLKRRYSQNRVLQCTPEVLVVVVMATIASWVLDLKSKGVVVLGKMDSGFRKPAFPSMDVGSPSGLISGAIMLAMLGFVETQMVSKKYSSKHQYTISPNRELVAMGCCSLFGSIFGAFSSFGSITRTKVADTAGVKTQLANLVGATVSLFVIVWLLPYFQDMPKAVTASIIFTVAISLFEFEEVAFIIRVKQWGDLCQLVAMFLVTYLLGVDVGIVFAFAACLLLAVKQTTLPGVAMLGRSSASQAFHDLEDLDEDAQHVEGILVYKIEGALYFANAEKMKESTKRAETQGGFHVHPAEEPQPLAITAVVFELSALLSVDSSALSILLEIVQAYRERNARVCIVKLRRHLRPAFERAGILAVIGGQDALYRSVESAVEAIQRENLSNLEADASLPGSNTPGSEEMRVLEAGIKLDANGHIDEPLLKNIHPMKM